MEITSNVYRVPGVSANPYLLVDNDGLTLVDTGIPGVAGIILHFIRCLGYAPGDLKRILVTHADYDHAGSLAALKKASGARVYASPSEAWALWTGRFPRPLKANCLLLRCLYKLAEELGKIAPVEVDEILSERSALPVLGGLQVIETAGHTPGHLSFFVPAAGILFTGDSIVHEKGRLVCSHDPVTWDEEKAHQSAWKQAALKARIVCPGHGPVVLEAAGRMPVQETGRPAPIMARRLKPEPGGD